MVYLLLAIASSAAISILMRLSTHTVRGNLTMLATNYLVCSLLGAAYAGFDPALGAPGFGITVGLGILNGVLFLVSFLLLQVNTRRSGIVLSSIFMKLGLLVPFVMSVLVFREKPTGLQLTGFCAAIGAIILLNLKKDPAAGKPGPGLLLLLLLGGSADAMAKVFDALGPAALEDQFLFFTFAVAFVLCVLLTLCCREKPGKEAFLYGALIGIPNFFSSKFLLGALNSIPAVVAYPTFCVTTMLIVTLTGVLVFREKLSRLQWLALALILAALAMLNI